MYARVTQFEIDAVVTSVERAVTRFIDLVLPELRKQPGYAGISVLANDEGRGMLVSYWGSETDAERALTSGFYDEQIAKFVTLYRQPPGREHFEVRFLEAPAVLAPS